MERTEDDPTPPSAEAASETKSPPVVSRLDNDEPDHPTQGLSCRGMPASQRPSHASNCANPGFSFVLPAPEATSDLLSRIGSFLPKIREANQELLEEALEEEEEEPEDDPDDDDVCHDSNRFTDGIGGKRKRKMNSRRIDACLEPDKSSSSSSSTSSSSSSQPHPSSTNGEHDNSISSRSENGGDDDDAAFPIAHSIPKRDKQMRKASLTDKPDEADASASGPIIEIHLALGTVEDNPIINLLADKGQDSYDAGEAPYREEDPRDPASDVVQRLLDGPSKASTTRASGKGPLITELH
jgi:hypothetical protein